MGSVIEINDTLKLKRGAGFPENITIGEIYSFEISGRRLYHLSPIRVFLVEEIDGKWNYHGHAQIHQLSIDAKTDTTKGQFEVVTLYPEELRKKINLLEAPKGKAF